MVRIHCLWDIHYGSAHCHYDLLDQAIQIIQENPQDLFILGGDNLEAISSADWRAFRSKGGHYPKEMTVSEMADGIARMRDAFVAKFKPIANRCIVLLEGNHEAKWGMGCDYELARNIAAQLEIPYGGYESAIVMAMEHNKSRYINYPGIVSHGWGGGMQEGGQINRQRLWADQFEGIRFTVRSHTHTISDLPIAKSEIVYGRASGKINSNKYIRTFDRLDIQAGSFMTKAHYTKAGGLRAKLTGWKMITAKIVNLDEKRQDKVVVQKCETMPF